MELLEYAEAAAAYRALADLEPDNGAWGECERKARALADASLYEVLGLSKEERADAAEIRRAYHAKSKQWHPDRHQATDEASRRANTAFQRITAAYETLSDPNKRADYDLQLKLSQLRRPSAAGAGGDGFASTFGRTASTYASANYGDSAGSDAASPRPPSSAHKHGGGGASREFGADFSQFREQNFRDQFGEQFRREYTGRWGEAAGGDGAENARPPRHRWSTGSTE